MSPPPAGCGFSMRRDGTWARSPRLIRSITSPGAVAMGARSICAPAPRSIESICCKKESAREFRPQRLCRPGRFACGTVAQANTRRYHGLLVAALQPPVQRVVMVAKLEALVSYRGRSYELGSSEFADGTITPRGLELLSGFEDQ